MPDNVQQLTAAIASGDTGAFARFYQQWFDTMYAQARRITGEDEAFCMDVVQDAMLRIVRTMTPKRDAAQLAAWLRTVVRSCAIDRLRSEIARRKREQVHAQNHAQHHAQHGGTFIDDAQHDSDPYDHDARDRLIDRLERLGATYREPLLMRYRFGWTLARIGAALGISPSAADGRITRGIKALRNMPDQPPSAPGPGPAPAPATEEVVSDGS